MLKLMDNPVSATAAVMDGAASAAALPCEVLDNLAARFRPGGLFLLMLRPDGTVAYNDTACGLFFQRFALPMIQYAETSERGGLREKRPSCRRRHRLKHGRCCRA
jgi:hypothetical protein